MSEPTDQQKLSNFETRVSSWLGKQGLIFHLANYGAVGSRLLMKQTVITVARLLVLLVILLGVSYFATGGYHTSDDYRAEVTEQIESALGLEELEGEGFKRTFSAGGFESLEMTGGPGSFFYEGKARAFQAEFGLLSGLTKKWNPSYIRLAQCELKLKGGGTTAQMTEAFSGLVKTLEGSGVRSARVVDVSCDWGYSRLTYGEIRNTELSAELVRGEWVISLKGGTFSQNWLRDFNIVNGQLILSKSGIEVDSLLLRSGAGSLRLKGEIGGPIGVPNFDLSGEFRSLSIPELLDLPGVAVQSYLDGAFSGNLEIFGSTNRSIGIKGTAYLGEGDELMARERFPILKALSILDTERSFRRVKFDQGSFEFVAQGGELTLSKINLLSPDFAKLKGDLATRYPSQEEAAESLGITLTDEFSSGATDSSTSQLLEDDRTSLLSVLDDDPVAGEFKFGAEEDTKTASTADELDEIRLRDEMKSHRFSGMLELFIPESSLAKDVLLNVLYPADQQGWRMIGIPIENSRFAELTWEANERILGEARGDEKTSEASTIE